MIWLSILLVIILLWLLKKHPCKSNFKVFDNYSYYISRYLDINKREKDREKDN